MLSKITSHYVTPDVLSSYFTFLLSEIPSLSLIQSFHIMLKTCSEQFMAALCLRYHLRTPVASRLPQSGSRAF